MYTRGLLPVLMKRHSVAWIRIDSAADATCKAHYVRLLTGVEHLRGLGFPYPLRTERLDSSSLRLIAGNSMSVPFLELLFVAILASVDFSDDPALPIPRSMPMRCDHVVFGRHIASPLMACVRRPMPGLKCGSKLVAKAFAVTYCDIPAFPPPPSHAYYSSPEVVAVEIAVLVSQLYHDCNLQVRAACGQTQTFVRISARDIGVFSDHACVVKGVIQGIRRLCSAASLSVPMEQMAISAVSLQRFTSADVAKQQVLFLSTVRLIVEVTPAWQGRCTYCSRAMATWQGRCT
jgi:hypothetical protein